MKKLHAALALGLAPLSLFADMDEREELSPPKPKTIKEEDAFYIYADFLWWKGNVDGLELADHEQVSGDTYKHHQIDLRGKWEPGFRAGIGYRFVDFDDWDLNFVWTHYHGRSEHQSIEANNLDNDFLRQGWITFLGPQATFAKGHWNVKLNTIDLDSGRLYEITDNIALRPHFGARGAWIDLRAKANYEGAWFIDEAVFTKKTSMRGQSEYSSGGIRAGSNFCWNFTPHWGLLGDLSASLLYGEFKVKQKFSGADPGDGPTLDTFIENFTEKMMRVRCNVELFVGLKWWISFNHDSWRASLFAGYELSEWFQLNELFRVIRTIDNIPLTGGETGLNANFNTQHLHSDIGFQGLTLKLLFEF